MYIVIILLCFILCKNCLMVWLSDFLFKVIVKMIVGRIVIGAGSW